MLPKIKFSIVYSPANLENPLILKGLLFKDTLTIQCYFFILVFLAYKYTTFMRQNLAIPLTHHILPKIALPKVAHRATFCVLAKGSQPAGGGLVWSPFRLASSAPPQR